MSEHQMSKTDSLNEVEIVSYTDSLVESHREFATRMWPSKRRRRNEDYIRWKYRGPSRGEVPHFVLALINNKVVGQVGMIPIEVKVDQVVYPAQWICDAMTIPEARGKGVGRLLFNASLTRRAITLGSNPSPSADLSLRKIGFTPLSGPRVMLLPLKIRQMLEWRAPKVVKPAIPFIGKIINPILTIRNSRLVRKNTSGTKIGDWHLVVDLIQRQQSQIYSPHVVHDANFLSWRCDGFQDYVPPSTGIRTVSDSFALIEATSEYCFVYDWSLSRPDDIIPLFGEIYRFAQDADSEMIRAYANTAEEQALLQKIGFRPMRTPVVVVLSAHDKEIFSKQRQFHYCHYDSDDHL